MATRGPGDVPGLEVRRLDQDRGGGETDLGVEAAHDTGDGLGTGLVGDDDVVGVEGASDVVEGLQLLPRLRGAHGDGPVETVAVPGVQRLAEFQHHVVGDVDGQRDRSHPALVQTTHHPQRGGRLGVETGGAAQHETVGEPGVGDLRGVAGPGGLDDLDLGGVVEVDPVQGGDVTGHAAHRQRVAAVGGDRDVEDVLAQFERLDRVGADLAEALRQDDDAAVVLPQAQLGRRADHAGRHPAVGLAGTDLETAGKLGPRKGDDDQVALGEVAGAADDLLRLTGAVGVADVDPTEADRLLETGQLLDLQDATEDDGAGQVGSELVDGLDLQTRQRQAGGELAGGDVGGQRDVFAQPGHGDAHQISLPNAEVKRTSPSTMSRMSRTSCANISVRSIPRPKAHPL